MTPSTTKFELAARLALGLCLGRLGDTRIVNLRDPEGYVEVCAGQYLYGEERETVEIAAPFLIGRYPVTNGQYAEFIDAGGYRDRQWWSEAGWAWLQAEEVAEPEYWRHRAWNAPNQPVVGVSFWEAEACCAWAGGRLPSAQEWEAAARGPNGFQYPWGNDWEDGICNTREAGLGVTSPVGLFARARHAELGIEDLKGNVWEWCDDPPTPTIRMLPLCCAAGRGSATRSWPSASRTARAAGASTSASGWCVRRPSRSTEH